jgi:hypothetical protein
MNIKKYLPVEDYVLTTKLSPQEVHNRIAANIEPRAGIRLSLLPRHTSKPYEGQIYNNQFTISRIIHYRNSFLPIIKGTISSYLSQTQIAITMKPHSFVLVFMLVWMGFVGLACVGILIALAIKGNRLFGGGFSPFAFIPFVMLVFGALLTHFAFKMESKKARLFLAYLLQGQESSAVQ